MPKHTPGPWKVTQIVENANLKSSERKNYSGSIAYVWTDRPYPKGVCIATVREHHMGETEANAHLIAKSPEHYEALRLIIGAYHLAEKSTPANLRRAIENAERMMNGENYEPYF